MTRFLAALMAALTLAFAPASSAANTWGTDFSDMWWIPTESGWGANIAHQREVVFMTLYVYGSDNRARWYAATNMQSRGGASAFVFDGTLYEFTGPAFGALVFNPSAVGVRSVGEATITFNSVGQASLIYSVDGVLVSKDIQRQTFRENNLSGNYVGTLSNTVTGCGSSDGSRLESGTTSISHSPGNAISFSTTLDGGGSCVYTGTYAQSGRLGEVTGTLSCTDGSSGTFGMSDIEAGYIGFLGRYTVNRGGNCSESGTMAWLVR